MKTKHTPGPWKANRNDNHGNWYIQGPKDRVVNLSFNEDDTDAGFLLEQANAALIAAASEMYALLTEAYEGMSVIDDEWIFKVDSLLENINED